MITPGCGRFARRSCARGSGCGECAHLSFNAAALGTIRITISGMRHDRAQASYKAGVPGQSSCTDPGVDMPQFDGGVAAPGSKRRR